MERKRYDELDMSEPLSLISANDPWLCRRSIPGALPDGSPRGADMAIVPGLPGKAVETVLPPTTTINRGLAPLGAVESTTLMVSMSSPMTRATSSVPVTSVQTQFSLGD